MLNKIKKMLSLIIVTSMIAITVGQESTTTKAAPLDLSPDMGTDSRSCKHEGESAYCVPYSQCRDNKTINVYGTPDDNEIRLLNKQEDCPERYHWCCVLEEEPAVETPTKDDCVRISNDTCPWCVSLYRDGGNPYTKSPSGLFCAGVLVASAGGPAVLTAASCLLAAKFQQMWLKIASQPDRNYTIFRAIHHPKYNSGTRDFDLGLIILTEKLPLQSACMQLDAEPLGECRSFGYDENDGIIMRPLTVTQGHCTNNDTEGASACGRSPEACGVKSGAPVLCPSSKDGQNLGLWGIARGTCIDDAVRIGSLASQIEWLRALIESTPAPPNTNLTSVKPPSNIN